MSAREETVRCLLLWGDQAELALEGAEDEEDPARWPVSAIAADTGLAPANVPGKRFRARVAEKDGRVEFAQFRLLE